MSTAQKDCEKQTVAEIKEELKALGLPISGNKKVLCERLLAQSKESKEPMSTAQKECEKKK
jgi:3-dehydroquinate synthetase